jgi:titin
MALVLALVLALLPGGHTARAATYTVTNTDDSGPGSLRQAIIDANNNPDPDTIEFNISFIGNYCFFPSGVCRIRPTSPLPALTDDGTTIDGYTQPGALEATETTSATLKIEIDGYNAGAGADGLTITSANNVVKGLAIRRFSGDGISISSSDATDNIISGNYIGTDANGTDDQGNAWRGVHIHSGAQNNTIGGATPGERNVISGNDRNGITISGSGNTVCGNYIGTDASGTADLGNAEDGVNIYNDAQNNIIGGTMPDERNIISGNDRNGISISGSGNTVCGNYVGTDASGTTDLGNTDHGVSIGGGDRNNTIGGATSGERNVISGNDGHGILIYGSSNTVSGNYIGTDASGTADMGNTEQGIHIAGGGDNNTIGGTTPGERNVISGNDWDGVGMSGSTVENNTVCGNYIGTDASGTVDLGNAEAGIDLCTGAKYNTVGPGNLITYNSEDGVQVSRGSDAISNTITQNSIFSNALGIHLTYGANGGIGAPVIFTTTLGSVNVVGSACPDCTVELFENSDTDGEGESYVANTTADLGGTFTLTVDFLSDPYLTATATDPVSGTSEFSTVFTATVSGAPPAEPIYLPIVLRVV